MSEISRRVGQGGAEVGGNRVHAFWPIQDQFGDPAVVCAVNENVLSVAQFGHHALPGPGSGPMSAIDGEQAVPR